LEKSAIVKKVQILSENLPGGKILSKYWNILKRKISEPMVVVLHLAFQGAEFTVASFFQETLGAVHTLHITHSHLLAGK
jgi:hypothetical protein